MNDHYREHKHMVKSLVTTPQKKKKKKKKKSQLFHTEQFTMLVEFIKQCHYQQNPLFYFYYLPKLYTGFSLRITHQTHNLNTTTNLISSIFQNNVYLFWFWHIWHEINLTVKKIFHDWFGYLFSTICSGHVLRRCNAIDFFQLWETPGLGLVYN